MMFAIITVALISGAISDRTKFGGWLLFAFGWFTLVYVPVAHWIWGGGWIGAKLHALDFAGGTAVHINAGSAALGLGAGARQAGRLAAGELQAAQRAVRRARRRSAVVRLVRLQRRFGAHRGRRHRDSRSSTPRSPRPPPSSAGSSSSGSATASRPWSAPRPARSPAWSRSPRPVASSPRWRRSCSASSPVRSARSRSSLKYRLRLRRLARRGRRPLRRRVDRLALDRPVRQHRGQRPTSRRSAARHGLFYGGGLTQLGRQALASASVTVYSFGIAFAPRLDHQEDDRLPCYGRGRGRRHRHRRARGERATSSLPSGGGGGAFAMAGIGTAGRRAPAEAPVSRKGRRLTSGN